MSICTDSACFYSILPPLSTITTTTTTTSTTITASTTKTTTDFTTTNTTTVVNVKFEFCSFTDVEISFYQEV